MPVKKPQPLTVLSLHDPVVPHARAPVGIIEPPFWSNTLRPDRAGAPQGLTAPAKGLRHLRQVGRLNGFGPPHQQRARMARAGPVPLVRRGPRRRQRGGRLLWDMTGRRMQPGDRLKTHPRPDTPNQVIHRRIGRQPLVDGGPRFQMAYGAAEMDRLCLHRFQPQHVDPETGVDTLQLHRQQGADSRRIARCPRQTDLDALDVVVAAGGLKQHPPRAPALLFKTVAQARQQAVDPGEDVFLQPDGIGQCHAHREMIRRLCR